MEVEVSLTGVDQLDRDGGTKLDEGWGRFSLMEVGGFSLMGVVLGGQPDQGRGHKSLM